MRQQSITKTPTALANVSVGQTYTAQFQSARGAYIATQASAPTANGPVFRVQPGAAMTFRCDAGESAWVFCDPDEEGGKVVYERSV